MYRVFDVALGLLTTFLRPEHRFPYRLSPVDGSIIAIPTPEQLAFQDREVGFIIHFEVATYLDDTRYDGCNSYPHLVPDIQSFRPEALNVTNWMESITAAGGKTATLVAKHNCGFTTWPTQISFTRADSGRRGPYDYSIQNSPFPHLDIPALFTKAASDANIAHGFYYSLNYNNYLNYFDFQIGNETSQGQVSVTKETYDGIVLDQLAELWTSHGSLTEVRFRKAKLNQIWFDGGFSDSQVDHVRKLVDKHQPQAVVFNGCDTEGTCVSKHPSEHSSDGANVISMDRDGGGPCPGRELVDTELTHSGLSNDGGDPTSKVFAPSECDTASYRDGRWFYGEHHKRRSLSELVKIYHETVGRNCFLELGLSPDRDGLVPSDHAEAYAKLGSFVRECYDHPLLPSESSIRNGQVHLKFNPPVAADRVVLMEDQTIGQVIREYTVLGRASPDDDFRVLSKGTSVGHKKIDIFSHDLEVAEVMIITRHVDTPRWRSVTLHSCDRI